MRRPVHVENGGKVVRVPVKEIFRRVPRSELIAQGEDLVNGLSSHQLTKSLNR